MVLHLVSSLVIFCLVFQRVSTIHNWVGRAPMYFGHTNGDKNLLTSVLWHQYYDQRSMFIKIREHCDYSDKLSFVPQSVDLNHMDIHILDESNGVNSLQLSSIVHGENQEMLSYSINGTAPNRPDFYYGSDQISVFISMCNHNLQLLSTDVNSNGFLPLQEFQLHSQGNNILYSAWTFVQVKNPYFLKKTIKDQVQSHSGIGLLNNKSDSTPNCLIHQYVVQSPFHISATFSPIIKPSESNPSESSLMESSSKLLNQSESIFPLEYFNGIREQFAVKVEKIYPNTIQAKHFSFYSDFNRILFSHFFSGLGEFFGKRVVFIQNDPNPIRNQKSLKPHSLTGIDFSTQKTKTLASKLKTFTPSKFGFPRGFFWDEAFHSTLIHFFDLDLFQQIWSDWFQLRNVQTGWIAREQIIGSEARNAAPEWSWVGIPSQMNPPALLIAFDQLVRHHPNDQVKKILDDLFQPLVDIYFWYVKTLSFAPGLYRWNGRTSSWALDSGLDDLPRFPTISPFEANIDLQSWMIAFGQVLIDLGTTFDYDFDLIIKIRQQHTLDASRLQMFLALDSFHDVVFTPQFSLTRENLNDNLILFSNSSNDIILKPHKHFTESFGFHSVLPLCLHILPPSQIETQIEQLERLFDSINSQKGVLLSLSRDSTGFRENGLYWRGGIWVNQNYICAQGLFKYEHDTISPQLRTKIQSLRKKIQFGVVDMVYANSMMPDSIDPKNGEFWEMYHPTHQNRPRSEIDDSPLFPRGAMHHPFCGWTSLALLMISEKY